MTTARQKKAVTSIAPIIAEIATIQPSDLVQKDRLGSELCFENLLPLITDVCTSISALQKVELKKIPYGVLSQLTVPLQHILNVLKQIATFSPSSGAQGRENLANTLEDQWNSIFFPVNTILNIPQQDNLRKEVEDFTLQIRKYNELSSDAAERFNARQEEVEKNLDSFLKEKSAEFEKEGKEKLIMVSSALEEVRKAAGEAGVSQTAVHFSNEANEHLKAATFWLFALIVVTTGLLTFSLFGSPILSWTGTPEPASNAETFSHIRYLSQKGLVIFCLIFALIWVARNYGAARHNYVVNKHRNNALGSFQAFVASASDDQTKNAVLIQATQSIFSPQPSGYIKADGDNTANSPIIEIVRAVSGASKEK